MLLSEPFEVGLQSVVLLHAGVIETLKVNKNQIMDPCGISRRAHAPCWCCGFWMKRGNSWYRSGFLLEGDFSIVVDSSLLLPLLLNVDPGRSQLSALLQSGQTPATRKRWTHSMVDATLKEPCACHGVNRMKLLYNAHVCVSNLASSSCFSLAFLLAFLPWVLASRALASDSISSSSADSDTQSVHFGLQPQS